MYRSPLIVWTCLAAACGTQAPTPATPTPETQDRCGQIRASVADAGFADRVSVTCDGDHASLTSDTYPAHTLMTGIIGTNEQIPVPGSWSGLVKLSPSGTDGRTSIDAALGVAVNGVPIYDYSSQGDLDLERYDPNVDVVVLGQLDVCGGHAGRGDDYHYHASPSCMLEAMANQGPDAILGWGFDGYPLYGATNPDGSAIDAGALDLCHGQADDTFGYRYHTSAAPPYVMQCLRGEVDLDLLPRVAPLRTPNGAEKPAGTPPRGGVEGLTHTLTGETRRMTYTYEGREYHIQYEPSGTEGCWNFDMDTVSIGTIQDEYCR